MNTPNQKSAFANLLQSNTFRMLLIGTLTLLLLIPLAFVKDLVRERKHRQERVIQEIDEKWGGAIFFYGPILKIPYKIYLDTKRTSFKTSYAYFFPEELKNTSEVETEVKKRNNYESVVFNATMNFTGKYTTPDFSIKGIPQEDVEWDKASILIRTTNLSSIKNGVIVPCPTIRGNNRVVVAFFLLRFLSHNPVKCTETLPTFTALSPTCAATLPPAAVSPRPPQPA